jgi:hypothetical protein
MPTWSPNECSFSVDPIKFGNVEVGGYSSQILKVGHNCTYSYNPFVDVEYAIDQPGAGSKPDFKVTPSGVGPELYSVSYSPQTTGEHNATLIVKITHK